MGPRFTDDLPEHRRADPPAALIEQIKAALLRILERRGLRGQPPSRLGYSEFDGWDPRALTCLAIEGYEFAIFRKWNALSEKHAEGGDINPQIYTNLIYFVHGLQASHDRPGSAIFANVRMGVGRAIRAGACRRQVQRVAQRTVRSDEPILFVGHPDAAPARESAMRYALERSFDYEALLPDMIVRNRDVQSRLAAGIAIFPEFDVLCFVLRGLAKPIQDDARQQKLGLTIDIDAVEIAGDPRLRKPDPELGDQPWRELAGYIDRARAKIVASSHQDRAKQKMLAIFDMRAQALVDGQDPPSMAYMAERLDTSASVVWENVQKLARLLNEGL